MCWRSFIWAASLGVAACGRVGAGPTRDGGAALGPTSTSTPTSTPTPTSTSTPTPTPTPTSTTTTTTTTTSTSTSTGDAGPSFCRVLRGPIELPLRGPAALSLRGEMLDAVLDDDGKPRVLSFPVGAVASSFVSTRESLDGGSAAGMTVACAV